LLVVVFSFIILGYTLETNGVKESGRGTVRVHRMRSRRSVEKTEEVGVASDTVSVTDPKPEGNRTRVRLVGVLKFRSTLVFLFYLEIDV